MAASSGAHMSLVKLEPCQQDKYCGIFQQKWTKTYITGFTEEEAKLFVDDKDLKFEDIQHLSGANPLLLSILSEDMDTDDYKALVHVHKNSFLERNLEIKLAGQERVEAFVEKGCLKDSIKFIYNDCELIEQDYEIYSRTWLYLNQVTISTFISEKPKKYTLHFNFQNLGQCLGKIICSCLKEITILNGI